MIRSMTGYGKGHASADGIGLEVEIRSVNSRQREVRCRLPQPLFPLETRLRERVQQEIARGRIDVYVNWERGQTPSPAYVLNLDGARAMRDAWTRLQGELGLADGPRLEVIMRMPGVFEPAAAIDLDMQRVERLLFAAADAALDQHREARAREGTALLADVTGRVATISRVAGEIRARVTGAPERQTALLRERVQRLLDDVAVDEARLAQEIVLAAQRVDVTEELIRLEAHLERMRGLIDPEASGVGRELEFLVQEARREISTLGVKASDAEVDARVVSIKADLEKIREQAANIE